MARAFLAKLDDALETFLENWTRHMQRAGYLTHTSAKRDDCIESYRGVMEPVRALARGKGVPEFGELLQRARHHAEFMVAEARKHRFRGVTAEMYFGCFKTFMHAIEDIFQEMDLPDAEKFRGLLQFRRVCDLLETVAVGDWASISEGEEVQSLRQQSRRLTLDKNKFENIFNATSDLVLVLDPDGFVSEANPAAKEQLSLPGDDRIPLWQLLELGADTLDRILELWPVGVSHEVSAARGIQVFTLQIVPLSTVSLASRGFMAILSDITYLVDYRRELERRVEERTVALGNSEKLFRSIFQAAGEGLLLVDDNGRVVQANPRSSEIYRLPLDDLIDSEVRELVRRGASEPPREGSADRPGAHAPSDEMVGRRGDGSLFPALVTVSDVEIGGRRFRHYVIRDISAQKALEEGLRQEKAQTEEMNVTLRTVLKSIDVERREAERSRAQRIRDEVLPGLDRVAVEPDRKIRSHCVDVIRSQLIGMTQGQEGELDARFLKLSRAEAQICEYIRAGWSSKAISDALNLSCDTVLTHRKNIRRKLGLRGKGVNLHAFLREQTTHHAGT